MNPRGGSRTRRRESASRSSDGFDGHRGVGGSADASSSVRPVGGLLAIISASSFASTARASRAVAGRASALGPAPSLDRRRVASSSSSAIGVELGVGADAGASNRRRFASTGSSGRAIVATCASIDGDPPRAVAGPLPASFSIFAKCTPLRRAHRDRPSNPRASIRRACAPAGARARASHWRLRSWLGARWRFGRATTGTNK